MYVLAWLNWFPKEEMTATTINRRYADFVLWRWGFVPTDHIDPHKYTHTYPITSHRQTDRWITKCSQMCCFSGSHRFLVCLWDSIVSVCVCVRIGVYERVPLFSCRIGGISVWRMLLYCCCSIVLYLNYIHKV